MSARDWWCRSLLALLVPPFIGVFASGAWLWSGDPGAAGKDQVVMWTVAPIWLGCACLPFAPASNRRALAWMLGLLAAAVLAYVLAYVGARLA